jgi:ATP-dependent helicase STH1/SNF2
VPIVSVRLRLFAFFVSSRIRVWKKRCTLEPGSSSTSTTKSFKLVVSITSRRKKSKRNSWYDTSLISVPVLTFLQRSILEADQDDENEEAGDMGDEEINEILARTDEEAIIFRDFDLAREREAVEHWKAAGNRGMPPPPLIQLEELPDCYRLDEQFDTTDNVEEIEGRGQRRRTVVNYNDGLSDDQWAMAVEEGEDVNDLADRVRQTRGMGREDSVLVETPMSETLEPKRGRGRGRKGKAKGADLDDAGPSNGKRKRGPKARSVTPSMADDDDLERDPVCDTFTTLPLPTDSFC